MADVEIPEGTGDHLGAARLITGLAQGLLLYGLYAAGVGGWWPVSNADAYAALLLVLLFVPLIAIQGIGAMRPATLLAWCMGAALLLACAGVWNRYALGVPPHPPSRYALDHLGFYLPGANVFWLSAVAIFVGHALVGAADQRRQLIAPYDAYFAFSWKLGVQAALTAGFVLAFWLVLVLASSLYGLLFAPISALVAPWLFIPLTALAAAFALHLTERRAARVAGPRAQVLDLMSWLLPVVSAITACFLVALLFSGMTPFWRSGEAARLMLAFSLVLILLVNAAWQEGPEGHTAALGLRLSGTAAALMLVPLAGLGLYSLELRVAQYGWSVSRVLLAAALTVVAAYAIGYAWAALNGSILRHRWLAGLARANIAGAFALLFAITAVLSPFADPMRIAAASQLSRLRSGKADLAEFDWDYLLYDTGRFGRAGIEALASDPSAPAVLRGQALAVLKGGRVHTPGFAAALRRQLKVYPAGYALPGSLFTAAANDGFDLQTIPCLRSPGTVCEVFPAALTGSPPDELLLVWPAYPTAHRYENAVLAQDPAGHWAIVGRLRQPLCRNDVAAMRAGQYAVVAPPAARFRAIETDNRDFTVQPLADQSICP